MATSTTNRERDLTRHRGTDASQRAWWGNTRAKGAEPDAEGGKDAAPHRPATDAQNVTSAALSAGSVNSYSP